MKQGDRFIGELARQEADARIRAELLKVPTVPSKDGLCPRCGASQRVWEEMLNERHVCY